MKANNRIQSGQMQGWVSPFQNSALTRLISVWVYFCYTEFYDHGYHVEYFHKLRNLIFPYYYLFEF